MKWKKEFSCNALCAGLWSLLSAQELLESIVLIKSNLLSQTFLELNKYGIYDNCYKNPP